MLSVEGRRSAQRHFEDADAAGVPEDPDVYSPMTSRIAHLAIIDVLAVGVALSAGPELAARLERSKQTLRDKRIRGY